MSILNNYRENTVSLSRHYFNEIAFTNTPFALGGFVFCLFFSIVLHLKKFLSVSAPVLLLVFLFFAWCIVEWCFEMVWEGSDAGRYVNNISAALVCGFVLFLISEVMLFGGFFWSYFDRVFNPGAIPGCHLPTGLERIDYWSWPLIGTIVLVTSGYFANHAYYSLRGGSRSGFYLCGSITLLLGILFLCIQLLEYNGLDIRISDNVYGSFFFLLTGFHGFHVTVGILFLFDQYFRLIGSRRVFALDSSSHIGVACALIYWHFVDVIWIFLFINVYVLNNTHFGDWMDTYFDYESAVMPVISFLECNDAEIFFLTECCGNMIYQEYPNY